MHNFDALYIFTIKFLNLGCAVSKLSSQATVYFYSRFQLASQIHYFKCLFVNSECSLQSSEFVLKFVPTVYNDQAF